MRRNGASGFTLVELMVVVALIALLVGVAAPTYRNAQNKAKEAVLRENLYILRQTIDQYFADKGYYPASLEALVDEMYLRRLPVDPYTGQADWVETPAEASASLDPTQPAGVWDVHSAAGGQALDGTPLGEL